MKVAELLYFNAIRIEKIIWLAGVPPDDFTGDLSDFFEDEEVDIINPLLHCNLVEDKYTKEDIEKVLGDLYSKGLQGFLVRAATPVPQRFNPNGGYWHGGFGHHTSCWFYTEAFDLDFVGKLVHWKDEFVEKCRRRMLPH